MAKALTTKAVENLRPGPTRREIADRTPLLYLVVQPSGRRRFCLRYRIHGKSRKVTLATGLSLSQARKAATDAAIEIERGNDPREARRAARHQAAAAAADTVRAVCEAYLKREAPKLRTADQRVRLLGRHVYPALGDRPISSVRRGEIVRLLDKVEDGSGSRTTDVVLSILRRVFNWHAIRDDTFVPPIVRGMGRHGTAQHARSRILNDEELGSVWRAAADAGPFGALLRFLLLTGARRGEAGGMTWDEVEDGVWSLPPSRNKTGQPLARPLSKAARAVLDAQPRIVGVPYVFTAGQRPLTSTSRMKKQFDAQCGVTGWTIHDLRRTARSLLSRCGVNADVAERCLGHVIGGVRGTYDRHQYQAEMAHAFEALAAQIEHIVHPRASVVPMQRKRK
jgi:integrase